MAKFEESKHPRDEDGKFTDSTRITSFRNRTQQAKIKDLEKKFVSDFPIAPKKCTLNQQEWRLWYKAVIEYKKCNLAVNELDDETVILKVETSYSNKIILTSRIFDDPKAIAMYAFKSSDAMNDFIERFKKKW